MGSGATVNSATLYLYPTSKINELNDTKDYFTVLNSSVSSSTTLTTSDYDQCGATDNPTKGSGDVDLGSITTSAYNTWTLNATGEGWVDETGFTYLCIREGHDQEDSSYANTPRKRNIMLVTFNENASNIPYLKVDYTAGAGGGGTAETQDIIWFD